MKELPIKESTTFGIEYIDDDPAMNMMDEFYYKLVETIVQSRKNIGYTQKELAKQVGINRVTLAKFETHKKILGQESIFRLMYLLNLRLEIIEN